MFAIEEGSEAFEFLKRWTADPTTYKVTFEVAFDSREIKLKRNESIWTLPLKVKALK